MKKIRFLIPLAMLFGCVAPSNVEVTRSHSTDISAIAMKSFANPTGRVGVARSNADIAQEFLDLTFALESGQKIPRLTKFQGKIGISLNKAAPAIASRELDKLIARLNQEAGLPVFRGSSENAQIRVETLPKSQMQSLAPTAACFVVPNVTSWAEYRRRRFKPETDWTKLTERRLITVFMPNDVSAQETRDCLHEEIAQALGPVNDLYRLPDSVFNDDNFNISLTAYDMLILRAYYDPQIRNGMTKPQVAKVLPSLLARMNPRGQNAPAGGLRVTSKTWVAALEVALGPRSGRTKRAAAAHRVVRLAKDAGYNDHRLAFSYYARAQVMIKDDPRLAAADFSQAYIGFKTLFGPQDIHTAHAAVQMASLALSAGKLSTALEYINASIPAAQQAQNGSLLFGLLAMKAEVFEALGQVSDAKALRREAISWGRYGIASQSEISRRLGQVADLRPKLSTKGF